MKAIVKAGGLKTKPSNWHNALHRAADSGFVEIVEYLLECGVDPHVVDKVRNAPTHASFV
jgi:ankyrin repeat protein